MDKCEACDSPAVIDSLGVCRACSIVICNEIIAELRGERQVESRVENDNATMGRQGM